MTKAAVYLTAANSPLYNGPTPPDTTPAFIEGPSQSGEIGVYSNVSGVTLDNELHGYIYGASGAGFSGNAVGGIGVELLQPATLDNSQTIGGGLGRYTGNGGIGVSMDGGTLDNFSTGTIKGGNVASSDTGNGGVGAVLSGVSATNAGHIYGGTGYFVSAGNHGNGGDGIDLSGGSTLNNSGQIHGGFGLASGGVGINAYGTGTSIYNHNAINGGSVLSTGSGNGGDGVKLSAGATLTNYSGASVQGGSPGSLNGAFGLGAYVGAQGTLINDGTVRAATVATGGILNNTGGTISAVSHVTGEPATGFGLDLEGGTATSTLGGRISGVYLDGGTMTNAAYIGSGFSGADVAFGSKGGTFNIGSGATLHSVYDFNTQTYGPNIAGFASGDVIDVKYLTPDQVRADYTGGNHTIALNGDGTDTLVFGGTFTNEHFVFNSDGGTGTDVELASGAPCFLRGTRIRTERGEVAVEQLRMGDRVWTIAGLQPIRWIGRRSYAHLYARAHAEVQPIRFSAGSLGAGLPSRDLWVSPDHALFINGALIPAEALVNGDSIVRDVSIGDVAYFHLEFDAHTIVFAEGAPAESFVDDESRELFDNAREFHRLYPDASREPAHFCAPRIEEGEVLEAIRRRLDTGNPPAGILRSTPTSDCRI